MEEPSTSESPKKEDFFNHWWKPGLLTQMIYAAHDRERNIVPDPEQLIKVFTERNLPGFVRMTNYLQTEPHLSCIGSSTVSMNPKRGKEFDVTKFMELREFHLGIGGIGLKPLQHIHHLAGMLDSLPSEVLTLLDGVFGALSAIVTNEAMDSRHRPFKDLFDDTSDL